MREIRRLGMAKSDRLLDRPRSKTFLVMLIGRSLAQQEKCARRPLKIRHVAGSFMLHGSVDRNDAEEPASIGGDVGISIIERRARIAIRQEWQAVNEVMTSPLTACCSSCLRMIFSDELRFED